MNYLKYTQYVYLVVAVFFLYKAFATWQEDTTDQHWLFFAIAIVSLFMFLFRRKFAKRFDDHSNKP
jgi:uncharacterized membrane protein